MASLYCFLRERCFFFLFLVILFLARYFSDVSVWNSFHISLLALGKARRKGGRKEGGKGYRFFFQCALRGREEGRKSKGSHGRVESGSRRQERRRPHSPFQDRSLMTWRTYYYLKFDSGKLTGATVWGWVTFSCLFIEPLRTPPPSDYPIRSQSWAFYVIFGSRDVHRHRIVSLRQQIIFLSPIWSGVRGCS